MSKNLVVVESPAKAKTIEKYLGKDFEVVASYGHVRDLVPKEGAVDPNDHFKMKYQVIDRNAKHVKSISSKAAKADKVYLATDPDREGEAISWHLHEILKGKKSTQNVEILRVVFYEITKNAVREAVANPRELSFDMVDAQQARRALDYLVGFNISPLLWRKVRPGLSAGRVQSPALRMIVEREAEIQAFEPQEYWTIDAATAKGSKAFSAKLTEYAGEKVKQFTVTNDEQAATVKSTIQSASGGELLVASVEKKQRKRNPAPPFITSTLQQEAARKLRYSTQRTMRLAQQLFEGVETDEGATGLITYMRTDSVTLANDAVAEIRQVMTDRYGAHSVPAAPRVFKTKSKNAQEAHEAVRPTSAARTPEKMRPFLDDDQHRLYDLIWKRTMASQMQHAVFDMVGINLAAGEGNTFRATGSTLREPGFMAVYSEGKDDSKEDDDQDKILPPMEKGDKLPLKDIITDQHFTEPPPRYSEASLVKSLEEYGIGRPSTYANIISTLVNREYVELESRRFTPTDIGKIVSGFLSNHFSKYVDYEFTANLEDTLDAVSRGEREWVPLLEDFWTPFKQQVDDKQDISREEVAQARQLGTDPKSGKPISVRIGRYGPFVQIGTKDDEEKPTFASLKPGQKMDDIDLEMALELFKLPRKLGQTEDGKSVSVAIGRFGPYVRYGDKFVSLKEDDPYTVELPRALELIKEKIAADLAKMLKVWDDSPVQIIMGRWGPYITDTETKKNAKMPKEREVDSMTLEECVELLAAAPEPKKRGRAGAKKKAPAKKTTAKKTTAKKAPAKKAATKKPAAKTAAAKTTAAKTTATKTTAVKKTTAKKTTAKKPAAKKATDTKTTAKK